MTTAELTQLTAGMPIPFGGNRVAVVSEALAAAFKAGDRLIVLQDSGDLLRVAAATAQVAEDAVGRAEAAFRKMGAVSDAQVSRFFDGFANNLEDDNLWAAIAEANAADVAAAKARGRSTTRLALSAGMRRDMIAGLREWRDAEGARGRTIERIEHPGWTLEHRGAGAGAFRRGSA